MSNWRDGGVQATTGTSGDIHCSVLYCASAYCLSLKEAFVRGSTADAAGTVMVWPAAPSTVNGEDCEIVITGFGTPTETRTR